MANIFFSYSHNDEQLVHQLSERLKEHFDVFFASEEILAGQEFRNTISNELRKTDAIVYVVTNNSVNSKWVNMEIGVAIGYMQLQGKPFIIPVVFDNATIPVHLQNIQSLRGERNDIDLVTTKLIHAINYQIGLHQAKQDKFNEIQASVKDNSAKYIEKSLFELKKKETKYRISANLWYLVSFAVLFAGLVLPIYRLGSQSYTNILQSISTISFSLIIIGLLTGLSRLAFLLGKAFMVESLRNSDRLHAISFGEFYLNAFGQDADWTEIKEAFQHWNIDKGSAFINQNVKDYDPEILKLVESIIKLLPTKS